MKAPGAERGRRQRVDYRSASGAPEVRKHRLGAVKGAEAVHPPDVVERARSLAVESGAPEDAGVVYEDVDPTEAGGTPLDQGCPRRGLSNVEMSDDGIITELHP